MGHVADYPFLVRPLNLPPLFPLPIGSSSLTLSLRRTNMATVSPTLFCFATIRDVPSPAAASKIAYSPRKFGTAFATGSPLLAQRPIEKRSTANNSKSLSVRCEQSAEEGSGVDVWLGRLAMVGFAAAISVEIGTGKGLLENFGLTSPLPTVALAVTALVGVLTAVFIFQSASSKN